MIKQRGLWAVAVCMGIVCCAPALADINGAIYTTDNTGTTVNGNIFQQKSDVFLNGGPQNKNANGLPDGSYYYQVTDPSGSVLLSLDSYLCRMLIVSGGVVVGSPTASNDSNYNNDSAACTGANGVFHASPGPPNISNGSIPVELCGATCPSGQAPTSPTSSQLLSYYDTPNNGGEYKVWLTPVGSYVGEGGTCQTGANHFGFCDSSSKTDNFKVQQPNSAYIVVCKFNDLNANGVQDSGEPLLPGWSITAAGVDTTSGTIGMVTDQTDATGCVSFSVTGQPAPATVTLIETAPIMTGWTETAPLNGNYDSTGASTNGNGTTSVSSFTETVTINQFSGQTITAPYFGNTQFTGCATCLTVTKTATPSFTRTFTWGITKAVDNTLLTTSSSATANYTVSVTHDNGTDSLWQVAGTITVANNTSVAITLPAGAITDALTDNNGSCPITSAQVTVAPNSSTQQLYTCTFSAAPTLPTGTNTASVNWAGGQQTGTASYNFGTVPPNLVDDSVTVTDTLKGSLGTVSYTDPSPKVFTYALTFNDPAGACTTHNNTASFTTDTTKTTGSQSQSVQVCVGKDLTVSKTAIPTYTFNISKASNQTSPINTSNGSQTLGYTVTVAESGWQVAGVILVSNPNAWEAVTVNLSDTLVPSGATCSYTPALTNISVPQSGSVPVSYTCTYSSAPTAASGSDTATATWSSSTAATPDGSASTGAVTFAFSTLTVTDAFNGANPAKTLGTISTPAASTQFPDSYSVSAPSGTCTTYPNTAAVTDGNTSKTAGATVQVCVGANLTVSKTATPNYTYSITKASNQGSQVQSAGSANLGYTIKVTESGWAVSGAITVNNPNNWEDVSVTLSDVLSLSGGTCSITGGTTRIVNRSSSISPTYTCAFASAPTAAAGTNTASASWNAATYATPAATASSGAVSFTFAPLTVTDSFNGANPGKTLGTITIPAALTTYTDSYSVTPTPGTCVTYPNTASDGTQSASVSVTVCNTKTNALTMGFWQGPQGQLVINNTTNSGATCTTVLLYLKAFNGGSTSGIFGDLTATTCSALNTYIGNVQNAANSSGGGALMLKGQLLATALTSYYSKFLPNPLAGQNTIGLLGNVWILLDPIGGTLDVRPGFSLYDTAAPHQWGEQVSTMLSDASTLWLTSKCSPTSGACTAAPYSNKAYVVDASSAFADINQSQANISPQ